MNLSLTTDCNRRCDYCFQRDWYLNKKMGVGVSEMPLGMFVDILHWVKGSGVGIQLMGGEPLLYSQIECVFEELLYNNIDAMLISNISIDSEKFKKLLPFISNNKIVRMVMINTDYPKSQRKTFLKNFELLCENNVSVALSTTLLPSSQEVKKSCDRICELMNISNSYNRDNLNVRSIRLAPTCPNPAPGKPYEFYDFSTDIVGFINAVWAKWPKFPISFDCPVNYCELNRSAIDAFKSEGLSLRTDTCGEKCPGAVDILTDGSIIWCSSANFIGLENWRSYQTPNDMINALHMKWEEYWNSTDIKCDYKNCEDFNPVRCHGVCAAKNYFIDQNNIKLSKTIGIKAL